jgi:hypothetical protein
MTNFIRTTILIVILVCRSIMILAQNVPLDAIEHQFYLNTLRYSNKILFVHYDKNVYVPSENIWFTAYILGSGDFRQGVLFVSLSNEATGAELIRRQFLIKNYISYGNIQIPDLLKSGEYTLTAVTDRVLNGRPT